LEIDFGAHLIEQLPALRRYARTLVKNAADADDLVQDTVLRAWSRQHLWDSGLGQLQQWLATICFRQFIGDRRRVHNSRTIALGDDHERSVEPSQIHVVHFREISNCLESLPDQQRRLLALAATGTTYREIAAATQLPLGTVCSSLLRTRRVLGKSVAWSTSS
jgi:RNA polymerase sigma-70 factor (ECF subfamily)